MKKFIVLPFLLLCVFSAIAQSPQAIPYQAVLRNEDGSAIANQAVTITFTIHNNAVDGTTEYQENHNTTSNALGLINLNVGQGTPTIGTFSAINWGSGTKFLQVTMNNGNGNIDLGTQQMLSVPYALYAANSGASSVSNFQGNIGKGFTMISNSQLSNATFAQALSFCYNLEEQGYNDWRLPTIEEILSYSSINGPQNFTRGMWTISISDLNSLSFALIQPFNNPSINGYFGIYGVQPTSSNTTPQSTCVR
jgi:hypothetical protein